MIVGIIWFLVTLFAAIWLGVVAIGPPYVPTLKRDLEAILTALAIGKGNHLVDLGAGDGRVLATAARRGARVSGVEINPFLVLVSRWRLRHYKGSVTAGNMWNFRLPDDTTHVFVFPAEVFMNKLERYLSTERAHVGELTVLCYGFRFTGRKPEKTIGAFNIYRF